MLLVFLLPLFSFALTSSLASTETPWTQTEQDRYENFLLRQLRSLRARPTLETRDEYDAADAQATFSRQINAIYAVRAFGRPDPRIAEKLRDLISETPVPGIAMQAILALCDLTARARALFSSRHPYDQDHRADYQRFIDIARQTLLGQAHQLEATRDLGDVSQNYIYLAAIERLHLFYGDPEVQNRLRAMRRWIESDLSPRAQFPSQLLAAIRYVLEDGGQTPFVPKVVSEDFEQTPFGRVAARHHNEIERMNAVVDASCKVSMLH